MLSNFFKKNPDKIKLKMGLLKASSIKDIEALKLAAQKVFDAGLELEEIGLSRFQFNEVASNLHQAGWHPIFEDKT